MNSRPLYFWFSVALLSIVFLLAWVVWRNNNVVEWNTGRIDQLIESRTSDCWTETDAREWREQLRKANPNLIVPD